MYLPFVQAKGQPTIGLKPLSLDNWLDIDEEFVPQLARKTWLLANRYQDVFVAQSNTQSAQQEILQLVNAHLLQYFSDIYQPLKQNLEPGIYNAKIQKAWRFSEFSEAPLDLAARLVQEDLCLLLPGEAGYTLAAASVCFPLRWTLREKLGQSIGKIHQRVPGYTPKLKRPVDNVFSRLREDFSGLRFNWSLVDSPNLYLADNKGATPLNATITPNNAGERLWLRVERQTLRRLSISGGILFTIRTYIYPLSQVVSMPKVAAQLAQAVQSLIPEMQVYKSLLPFRTALLGYLDRCCASLHQS